MTDEPIEPPEYWYRADDIQYAGPLNEYDEPTGSPGPVRVRVFEIRVHHHTRCGVVLCEYSGLRRRFVNRSTNKRWACPTKEEALRSLIARRKRQAEIYEARAKQARRMLSIAEAMLRRGDEDVTLYSYEEGSYVGKGLFS